MNKTETAKKIITTTAHIIALIIKGIILFIKTLYNELKPKKKQYKPYRRDT